MILIVYCRNKTSGVYNINEDNCLKTGADRY